MHGLILDEEEADFTFSAAMNAVGLTYEPAEPAADVEKFNPNHEPAGSSIGGQFAESPGGGAAEDSDGAGKPDKTGYTRDEKDAFGKYIDDSTDINKYYRNGRMDKNGKSIEEFDRSIDAIKGAMSRTESSNDATLFRGISECKVSRDLFKNAERMIGKDVPLGGFQSTSADPNIAAEFVGGYSSPVILQIDVPKGTHMLDLSPFADNFAKQKEFLLGEGSLTIKGVERPYGRRGPVVVIGTFREK